MRFFLTLLVWVVTGTIVFIFFAFRGGETQTAVTALSSVERDISIEVTTSFNTEKNLYSISDEPLMAVFLDGKLVYESDEKIIKGRPLVFKAMRLKDGVHEIMVTANAVEDGGSNAVRIKVDADGVDIGDSTEWFDSGQNIVSVMRFKLGKDDE